MLELVDSLDLKSSGIYSRGGSSPPEATKNQLLIISLNLDDIVTYVNLKLS